MKILALDLATVTGWAVGVASAAPSPTALEAAAGTVTPVTSGFISFREHSGEPGYLYRALEDWLHAMIDGHSPDIVVFEAPLARNAHTARLLFGMAAIAEMVAAQRGIECAEVHVSAIKKHATGHGMADKKMMIAAALQRGWKPREDNEADALWLWDYAATITASQAAKVAA